MKDLTEELLSEARQESLSGWIDDIDSGKLKIEELSNYEELSPEDIEYIRINRSIRSTSIDSYTWGIDVIDEKITTAKKGKVIVMVSDENEGKSTFCYFFARKNFTKYGHNVVYFNLEQTKAEVINDMATQYARCTKLQIRDNQHLSHPLYLKRKKELETQEDICFLGRKAESVTSMREIRSRISEEPMDMLILDNLTCIEGEGGNRNDEVKNIALELIELSQKHNIPIILVHHYRKKDRASSSIFRGTADMEGSGALKNLVPMIVQVARNPEPSCPAEFAEFHIREGKLRGGARKESVVVYHDRGEFISEQKYAL